MHVYMYIYIYIHTHTCTHTEKPIPIYAYTRAYVRGIHTHTYTYIHTRVAGKALGRRALHNPHRAQPGKPRYASQRCVQRGICVCEQRYAHTRQTDTYRCERSTMVCACQMSQDKYPTSCREEKAAMHASGKHAHVDAHAHTLMHQLYLLTRLNA